MMNVFAISSNEWLAENKDRIKVFFLPPYSPELIPQEYVNQEVKTNILERNGLIDKAQMRAIVEGFMEEKMIESKCKNIFM